MELVGPSYVLCSPMMTSLRLVQSKEQLTLYTMDNHDVRRKKTDLPSGYLSLARETHQCHLRTNNKRTSPKHAAKL